MGHSLPFALFARIHATLLRSGARRVRGVHTADVGKVKVTRCDVARYETARYIDPHLWELFEPRTALRCSDALT
jgi:hypothetical protein